MSSDDDDRFISNGTCYFGKNWKADPHYIPCGNVKYGHVPCCQAGDFCMDDNVCFDQPFGNTYIAGCTNGANYDIDGVCPFKGGQSAQPWVGLVQCSSSFQDADHSTVLWQGCSENPSLTTIGVPFGCVCNTALSTVAHIYASTRILQMAVLPTALGGSFTTANLPPSNLRTPVTSSPSSAPSPSSTPTSTSSSTSTTASSSSPITTVESTSTTATSPRMATTAPPTSSPSAAQTTVTATGDTGLTAGAKAGIGVGVTVGAVALLAILWFLYSIHRRLQGHSAARPLSQPPGPYDPSFFDPHQSSIPQQMGYYPGYAPVMQGSPKPDDAGMGGAMTMAYMHPGAASPAPGELDSSMVWTSELPGGEFVTPQRATPLSSPEPTAHPSFLSSQQDQTQSQGQEPAQAHEAAQPHQSETHATEMTPRVGIDRTSTVSTASIGLGAGIVSPGVVSPGVVSPGVVSPQMTDDPASAGFERRSGSGLGVSGAVGAARMSSISESHNYGGGYNE